MNERSILPLTFPALRQLEPVHELLFVDGGSTDGTAEWLAAQGYPPICCATASRGAQLAEGARHAGGEVLWFLHADCSPEPNAATKLLRAVEQGACGGVCEVRFVGRGLAPRFVTWLYPRLAWAGLYYGDAGIFVTRHCYERAGGFAALPLFEDLDLVHRLRRLEPDGFRRISAQLDLSARRFEGNRFPLVFLQWAMLQSLYGLGVSPARLRRLYRPVR